MSEIEPDRVIAGKYRVLERISGGGMGSLWRAHHLQLDAPIAIKFMNKAMLEVDGATVRFEREAKAAAQLRSPHVVQMYDHGIEADTGMPFIAMELLEGEDLSHRLKRERVLSPELVLKICQHVCKGLARAHEIGIVHRDLKPANVFLCEPNDDVIKILDFGVAKEIGEQQLVEAEDTITGALLGSPHYMSPEQARAFEVDGRSDLWSLAVIMYRALTGKRAFDADAISNLLVRICTEPVPPPSSINSALGVAVDRFFERALTRAPDGRFQNAEEFAKAFADALEGRLMLAGAGVARPKRVHRARSVVQIEEADKQGGLRSKRLAISVGVILAGAIILLTWVKPGQLTMRIAYETVRYAVGAFVERVTGSDGSDHSDAAPVDSSTAPPDGSADASAPSEQAREAWLSTYKQVRIGELALAVDSLPRLLEVYPNAPVDKRNTFVQLAERVLDRQDATSDKLSKLLTTGMGEHGPDLLFDLVATRGETRAAKRAKGLLANAAVRQRGSKDMQLAYAIHFASACRKQAHILRAKAEGGDRTLREIQSLTLPCKERQKCCLNGNEAVEAVEAAIQERQ